MIGGHTHTTTKYPCRIVTVDPISKTVQGIMRTGPVHIAVYTTSPFFRWPVVGENWIVKQENGIWYLDSLLQSESDPTLINDLQPGEAHVNIVGKVHTSKANTTLPQKYTQIVGDGSKKAWTIAHDLNDYALQVGAIATASPNAPITAFTWAPVVLEGGKGDPNNLTITFTVAPITKGAQVVVIG